MGAGERERLENGDQGTEVKRGEGPREGGVRSILEFLPDSPGAPSQGRKMAVLKEAFTFFPKGISERGKASSLQ